MLVLNSDHDFQLVRVSDYSLLNEIIRRITQDIIFRKAGKKFKIL